MRKTLSPGRICLAYAAIALLWIGASDWLLTLLVDNPAALVRIGTFKGYAFVAVTAGLLYLLLTLWRQSLEAAAVEVTANDRRPGGRHLSLSFLALAMSVPLLGYGVVQLHGPGMKNAALADLRAVAELKAGQIETWLHERRGDSATLAASNGFVAAVDRLVRDGDSAARAQVARKLAAYESAYAYEAFLVTIDGRPVAGLNGRDLPADGIDDNLFVAVWRDGGIGIRDLYRDAGGRIRFDFYVPLYLDSVSGERTPLALVILSAPVEGFLYPLIQTWPSPSASAETALVRRDGDSVLVLNELRHEPGTALNRRLSLDTPGLPSAASVLSGVAQTMEGLDYRGVSVLAATRPVDGMSWHLVAKIDRDEVLAPLIDLLFWIGIIAFFAVVSVAAAVLMLWRLQGRTHHLELLAQAAEKDRVLRHFYDLPLIGMAIIEPVIDRTLHINDYLCDMLGYPRDELLKRQWMDVAHPQELTDMQARVARILAGESNGFQRDSRLLCKDGSILDVTLNVQCVRNRAGQAELVMVTVQDISERKASEAKLEFLAHHDPLTGLPNRRVLLERLECSLARARRDGGRLALLMLDLDRFKDVNDSFGHLAGDELLQQVAARLIHRLRGIDTVCRLGGDEFAILLEDIEDAGAAAAVARDILDGIRDDWRLSNGTELRIGASVGISLYPDHGDSAEVLLQQVDAALYQAKAEERGSVRYYSDDLTRAARSRIDLENRLRRAISHGELRLHFQPQLEVGSGAITGAEALVRWEDPEHGLIAPDAFIPVAEETGLISELGAWVLRETCRQGRAWLDAGLPPLTLAVNLSPHQFRHSDIGATVAEVLATTGFPPQLLELELTESVLMAREDEAVAVLERLRAQGVRLAIDDFGTGYSSLAYLKRFPLDLLKIDKGFIRDIPDDRDDCEIATAIIAMAHALGFRVLAEGVETRAQLEFLRERGCDLYQGFHASAALPADDFAALFDDAHDSQARP